MAASCIKILTLPVVAAVALAQFRAVTGTGAIPAAGARILGVTDYACSAGERVAVGVMGTVIAEAGAAFAVDALLEVDAQGRFITANTGVKVARALSAAGAAGVQAEILLIPN